MGAERLQFKRGVYHAPNRLVHKLFPEFLMMQVYTCVEDTWIKPRDIWITDSEEGKFVYLHKRGLLPEYLQLFSQQQQPQCYVIFLTQETSKLFRQFSL